MSINRDSVVGIGTGYELDDRGVGVRVLVGSRIFFCSAFYPMGTGGALPGGKATRA
jgi:hypothetical protein